MENCKIYSFNVEVTTTESNSIEEKHILVISVADNDLISSRIKMKKKLLQYYKRNNIEIKEDDIKILDTKEFNDGIIINEVI